MLVAEVVRDGGGDVCVVVYMLSVLFVGDSV